MLGLVEVKLEPSEDRTDAITIQEDNGKGISVDEPSLDFKCRYCSKSFHKSYNKKRHEETVHSKNETSDRSTSANVAPILISTTKGDEEQKCNFCSFSTKFMSDLKLHESAIHPKKSIESSYSKPAMDGNKCKYCSFYTVFSNDLKLHESTVHSKKISIDSKIPEDPLSIDSYINSSSDENKCKYCSFTSKFSDDLKLHETSVHANKAGSDTKIPTDPLKIDNPSDPQEPPDRKCNCCGFLTKFLPDLKAHEALVHGKKRAHRMAEGKKCKYCTYSSRSENYIEMHEQMVHSSKPNLVPDTRNAKPIEQPVIQKCNFCNYSTKFDSDLLTHMEVHIEKVSPKQNLNEDKKCKLCDFSTKFISDLKAHADMAHPGVPSDIEELEDTRKDIVEAVNEHDVTDSYRCSFPSCSKKFTEHQKKIRHEAVAHLQEGVELEKKKPFNEGASENLKDSKTVSIEAKSNKDGKIDFDDFGVYKCDYCSLGFTRKSSKIRHESSNSCSKLTRTIDLMPNSVNCFPCRYCKKVFSSKETKLIHEQKNQCSKLAKVCEGVLPVASPEHPEALEEDMRVAPDLQCQFCQRVFLRADKRRSHESSKLCIQAGI